MTKEEFKNEMTSLRDVLAGLVNRAVEVKGKALGSSEIANAGEVAANITIAYRHLEDAAMRFGKAIQASDTGVSPLGGPNTPTQ